MNQQTKLVTDIIIHNIIPDGPAFGHMIDTEEHVFIPTIIADRTAIEVGNTCTVELKPNVRAPEKTPWFCSRVIENKSIEGFADIAHLLIDIGGVWSVEDLAEETGMPESKAAAAAENLYHAGKVSKFIMFRRAADPASRSWYTANPDAADVAEWEE
jgi:hypothetical protein